MKKSFVLYLDQYEPVKDLTQEQKGDLFDAMFLYNNHEKIEIKDPVVKMAFSFFEQTFKRDCSNYLKRCEKNSENAKIRWNKKNAVACDRMQVDAKHADSDNDSDKIVKENIPDSEESGFEFYHTKKKRKLTGKRLETFNEFWKTFNFKKGKAEAADSWYDIPTLTDSLVKQILESAKIEADNRQALIDQNKSPKWAQGWLSGKRWEDEITVNNNSPQSAAYKEFTE